MARKKHCYHYLYKTTNLLNSTYYYGIHSTGNLEDGYLGSGKYLRNSIRKYGKENFKREILEFFDNRIDLAKAEENIITESMLKDKYCMNIKYGGDYGSLGMVNVKDKEGKGFSVLIDDPRYLSGELVGVTKYNFMVKDKEGNIFQIHKNDPRYLSGELTGITKGYIPVKYKEGNTCMVSTNDPRYLSGELTHVTKGKIMVKDKEENTFQINIDDSRYLSGELVPIWKDKKHKEETKQKIKESIKGKQKGNKNSQFGKKFKWVNNIKINKKVELKYLNNYLKDGWILGIMPNENLKGNNHSQFGKKFKWINNTKINKKIELDKLDNFLNNNWILGKIKK